MAGGSPAGAKEDALLAPPLVVGVTGHRKLPVGEARRRVAKAVATTLAELRAAWPHAPIVVLSPLAQGADQLVARVALGLSTAPGEPAGEALAGARVLAPLPMPLEAYRASGSFASEAERRALDELLAHPRVEALVIDLPEHDAERWEQIAVGEGPAERALRDACYASVGAWVVRRAHALIALWDGDTGRADGAGTAGVVRLALSGAPPAALPRDATGPLGLHGQRTPVMVVATPRDGPPAAAGARELRLPWTPPPQPSHDGEATAPPRAPEPFGRPYGERPFARPVSGGRRFCCRVLDALSIDRAVAFEPAPAELERLEQVGQCLDDLARELADLRRRQGAAPAPPPSDLPLERGEREQLARLDAIRGPVGALADRMAERLALARSVLFGAIAAAVVAFQAYTNLLSPAGEGIPWLLALSLVALFVAITTVVLVWYTRADDRRLDYRALAECLRVQRAWSLAGLAGTAAEAYPEQLAVEMSWTRMALEHFAPAPLRRAREGGARRRLEAVRAHWVLDQHEYFRTRGAHHAERARQLKRVGFGAAVLGWLTAFELLFDARHPSGLQELAAGLLLAAGAIALALRSLRSHGELAEQYEHMEHVFRDGYLELGARLERGELEPAREVLRVLGEEAVAEHARWLVLRRAKGFELPV